MEKNVGGFDRMARLGAGAILVVLTLTGTIGIWGWIGVIPLVTGALGWCPLYIPFGFKTCKGE